MSWSKHRQVLPRPCTFGTVVAVHSELSCLRLACGQFQEPDPMRLSQSAKNARHSLFFVSPSPSLSLSLSLFALPHACLRASLMVLTCPVSNGSLSTLPSSMLLARDIGVPPLMLMGRLLLRHMGSANAATSTLLPFVSTPECDSNHLSSPHREPSRLRVPQCFTALLRLHPMLREPAFQLSLRTSSSG